MARAWRAVLGLWEGGRRSAAAVVTEVERAATGSGEGAPLWGARAGGGGDAADDVNSEILFVLFFL